VPDVGVDLNYFVDPSGFVRSMAQLESPGPVWIGGIVVLRDASNRERMFAYYDKIRGTADSFSSAERGLVEYDDKTETFRHAVTFPKQGPFPTGGHPLLHKDGGTEYFYFCDPFPRLRVRADVETLKKPAAYEAYTCLTAGGRLADVKAATDLDVSGDGKLHWTWKADTDAVGYMGGYVDIENWIIHSYKTRSTPLQIYGQSSLPSIPLHRTLPHR